MYILHVNTTSHAIQFDSFDFSTLDMGLHAIVRSLLQYISKQTRSNQKH